jgi:hypothetical protein
MRKPLIVLAALAVIAVAAAPVSTAPMSAVEQYQRMCANVLNFLPRIVRKEQVAAIRPDTRVVLHSICRGVDLFDFGNAAGLGRTIAANPTLARALSRHGWRPDDVVGIAIRGSVVDLYDHRF